MRCAILSALFVSVVFGYSTLHAETPPENKHPEALYYANAYADHYRIPRELVHAIIEQESGWNQNARSNKGAIGLMQLMPATANFAHILVTARGANVAFLFALQSAPQLLQVGRGFRNDVASAPNTTFMLRIKDEETAQDFLKASARIRQMRRSMRIRKTGLFQTNYKEEGEGSQTEIKDTLAQEEHIKRMPTGQMEMLAPDKIRGVVHRHLHIRQPFRHWFSGVPENLYPKYASYIDDSEGLNLRFPNPELEEKRTRQSRKRSS